MGHCCCKLFTSYPPRIIMILSSSTLFTLVWGLLKSIQNFGAREELSHRRSSKKIPLAEDQVNIPTSVGKKMAEIASKQVHSSETLIPRPASSSLSTSIIIPDTLRSWPWPRHLNPHYAICKEESEAWCEAFHAFSPSAQKAFNLGDFSLLAALAYPLLDKGCDFMNLAFVIDEHTDVADGKTARNQADIVMDALRNPHTPRPTGEWVGGEVARQFWLNAVKIATPSSQRRFIDSFQTYTDAVVQEAVDRGAGHIRDVQSYFEVRRETIGAKPAFALVEIQLTIPGEVMKHPVIVALSEMSIDMVLICNDLCSYNVEQAKDADSHNLVRIVMEQYNTDAQTAMNCLGKLHDELAEQFCDVWMKIPTFGGPVDREIRTYLDGVANWVRANDTWSFESMRYFGNRGLDVQSTRKDQLLSRSSQ
ncbi:isoprenoid synthase domain-containing protein [Gautieria morchelliformis]|nr:isoprenoid synthase domain-containing protein [Gautieria morchelliformis]